LDLVVATCCSSVPGVGEVRKVIQFRETLQGDAAAAAV
jgi:hypothetical protein